MNRATLKKKLYQNEAVIDIHTHIGISPKFYYQYGYPYALSFEDMVIRMEMLGIDSSSKVKTTTKYCDFPYETENRNMLNEINEIFPKYSHKALPFLMFDPSRETQKQADYMETLIDKYPVFGLKTATTYIQSFVTDMETIGKPILDLARKKQLPITFHSSVHPKDPWAHADDIVALAERNPDIRFCIAHCARFLKPVLERANKLDNCFVDYSAFIIHCKLAAVDSEAVAIKELRFDAGYNDPLDVMMKLAKAYPNTMLWGSDTPFNYWIQKYYTSDEKLVEERLECGYKEETDLLHELPKDIITRIAYTNNLQFLFGE